MLFQDKLVALTYLLMLRTGCEGAVNNAHPVWEDLQDAGMVDQNLNLTNKGWETANRLANEFGELL